MEILSLIVALFVGFIVAWLIAGAKRAQALAEAESQARAEIAALKERLQLREQELAEFRQRQTAWDTKETALETELSEMKALSREIEVRMEEEQKNATEKIAQLQSVEERLNRVFQGLSADALRANNQAFLDLAKATLEKFQAEAKGDLEQRQKAVEYLLAPIKETLDRYDQQIQSIEKSRSQAYGSLSQQVESLLVSQQKLESETGKLVKALRQPQVRGRWGEFQLRKVVELAGMSAHCDFAEQETVSSEAGRLRPDLIVKLPGAKNIVVDSKASLQAYLDALEADNDEQRKLLLSTHARQIRSHLQNLSSKAYWSQLKDTPEFVVLFIPGESFLSAAAERDTELLEDGVRQRVIFATPLTLIALLRAVAYGWTQERIADNARKISDLGKELYERVALLTQHFRALGQSLGKSVKAYNDAVGSLEGRVLASARKFKELGATPQNEILELAPIEQAAREIQAAELLAVAEGPGDEASERS
ncbi:MAG: DNA recombination protein RmuC [Acidobacteria bacterium]|nr:DNA recombination protein RmuC [Acidobacteriota bacterium]MCI0627280.1 DNA recombination protein RmuC [Acidobacteriota bacterium]MCI0722918.1 DNA recombination protein RmuC [Acidobacteriota bacterium]